MDTHANYFIDVLFSITGLFFATYIIYGRVKRKPLIGDYKAGTPGYEAFRKIVENNKYLAITILGVLFFVVSAAFDARTILHSSSSRAILIVAPILNVLVFLIGVVLTPFILGKSNKE